MVQVVRKSIRAYTSTRNGEYQRTRQASRNCASNYPLTAQNEIHDVPLPFVYIVVALYYCVHRA